MVKLGSTVRAWNDTTSIALENISIGFNSYRYWLFCYGRFKLTRIVFRDIDESTYTNFTLSSAIFTFSINCSVGVVRFEFKFGSSYILKGGIHPSTIATSIISITVNKLLFWKRIESTCLNGIHTFNSGNRWESPAWTALTLILNWINSTLCSPVNWCRVTTYL